MAAHLITSPQNPRIKATLRLRHARYRTAAGEFLVDGVREIQRALEAGMTPQRIFLPETWPDNPIEEALDSHLAGTEVHRVSNRVLNRIAYGQRGSAVAVFRHRDRALSLLPFEERSAMLLVVVGVEKPGNLGAMLRSADGAGATGVIVADPACDLESPHCIRASMGAVFHVPVAVCASEEALRWLRDRHVAQFAARVDGERSYSNVDWKSPAAIIVGSEDRGLSAAWWGDDIARVRIPMLGTADSLNVAAAAAVILYEAARQRGFPSKADAPRGPRTAEQ